MIRNNWCVFCKHSLSELAYHCKNYRKEICKFYRILFPDKLNLNYSINRKNKMWELERLEVKEPGPNLVKLLGIYLSA